MKKISGIYKITNTITGDFYIGSSKNVKERWKAHKRKSVWNRFPNSQLYKDMKKYGIDKFSFQVIAEVEIGKLKEMEQKLIETLKPTYNDRNADGLNTKKRRKSQNKYYKSSKEEILEQKKRYNNQLCFYNGQTLTLCALSGRFKRRGISNPTLEAKKYLIKDYSISPSS